MCYFLQIWSNNLYLQFIIDIVHKICSLHKHSGYTASFFVPLIILVFTHKVFEYMVERVCRYLYLMCEGLFESRIAYFQSNFFYRIMCVDENRCILIKKFMPPRKTQRRGKQKTSLDFSRFKLHIVCCFVNLNDLGTLYLENLVHMFTCDSFFLLNIRSRSGRIQTPVCSQHVLLWRFGVILGTSICSDTRKNSWTKKF